MGKMCVAEHQLCYAHALHLAVCDVLYKHPEVIEDEDNLTEERGEDTHEEEEEDEAEEVYDDTIIQESDFESEPVITPNIEALLKKVRFLVNIFRRSPTKNEILQIHIKQEHAKELQLIRDCKTRWNSILAMVERFLYLRKCITKALVDLSIRLNISDEEFMLLEDLKAALEPIKLAVEALCRQDATILTADGIFRFLLAELKCRNTRFMLGVHAAVERRITERRSRSTE